MLHLKEKSIHIYPGNKEHVWVNAAAPGPLKGKVMDVLGLRLSHRRVLCSL